MGVNTGGELDVPEEELFVETARMCKAEELRFHPLSIGWPLPNLLAAWGRIYISGQHQNQKTIVYTMSYALSLPSFRSSDKNDMELWWKIPGKVEVAGKTSSSLPWGHQTWKIIRWSWQAFDMLPTQFADNKMRCKTFSNDINGLVMKD